MPAEPLTDHEIAEVRAEARLMGIHPGDAELFSRLLATIDRERAARDELEEDRKRALKRAYDLTLETQTCEEAVADLVRMVREGRAAREKVEAALAGYVSDGELVRQLLKAEADAAAMRGWLQRFVDIVRTSGHSAAIRDWCEQTTKLPNDAGAKLLARLAKLEAIANIIRPEMTHVPDGDFAGKPAPKVGWERIGWALAEALAGLDEVPR